MKVPSITIWASCFASDVTEGCSEKTEMSVAAFAGDGTATGSIPHGMPFQPRPRQHEEGRSECGTVDLGARRLETRPGSWIQGMLTLFKTPSRDQHFGPRSQASQFAGDVNFLRGCCLIKSRLVMTHLFPAMPPTLDFFPTFATTHAITPSRRNII